MQLRLKGTRTSITQTLEILARVLRIHHVSRFYTERPPSTFFNVYLTVEPKENER